jgi:hypothetical protein
MEKGGFWYAVLINVTASLIVVIIITFLNNKQKNNYV